MAPHLPDSPAPTAVGGDRAGTAASLAVRVNGELRNVPVRCTVEELLGILSLDRRRIAVAVNREVVPRSAFDRHALAAGDRIEILEAVGGG